MSDPLQMHPRFISLEGGEGAGKTSAIAAIRALLHSHGHDVVLTREPGGTPFAERIRELLLGNHEESLAAETELLLMFAARAQHVRQVILPALQRGAYVVSDRFTDSSYAYQAVGRGMDPAFIAELERRVVGIKPGLTVLMDVDVGVGRARAKSRDLWPDRIESEKDDFFERVREGFRQRATAEPERFRVVDAGQSPADVAAAVTAAIAKWLEHSRGG